LPEIMREGLAYSAIRIVDSPLSEEESMQSDAPLKKLRDNALPQLGLTSDPHPFNMLRAPRTPSEER
jgi:hypothetical protein